MALKTNYKDYRFQEGEKLRKYRQISNDDGTISFEDVTSYQQEGDRFSASDINATNTEVNKIVGVQEITLGTSWSSNQQTVSLQGITENDRPLIDVKLSGSVEEMEQQEAEWAKILKVDSAANALVFTAREDTTMQLTVMVKGK